MAQHSWEDYIHRTVTHRAPIVGHSAPKQPASKFHGLWLLFLLSSACFLSKGNVLTAHASFNRFCSLEKGHWLFFPRSNSGCGEQKYFGLIPCIIYKGTYTLRWKHTGWALLSTRSQHTQVQQCFHFPWFSIVITFLVRTTICPPYKLSSYPQIQQNTQCISFNVYGKYLYTQALHKVLFITMKIKQYQDPCRAMNFLLYC